MSSQTPRRLSLRRKRPPSDAEAKNSPSKRLSPSIDEDETQVLNLRSRVALKPSLKKSEDLKTNLKSPNSRIYSDNDKQYEISKETPLSCQRQGKKDSHRLRSLLRSTESRAHLLSPDSPFACSQLPSTQDCEVVWDCNSPGYSKEELKLMSNGAAHLIPSKAQSPITTATFHPNRILFNQSRPSLRSRKEKNKNNGIVAELDDLLTKVQNEELNHLNDSFSDDDTMPVPLLPSNLLDRSTQPFDISNLEESDLPKDESQNTKHKNLFNFTNINADNLSADQMCNNGLNKMLLQKTSNKNSDLEDSLGNIKGIGSSFIGFKEAQQAGRENCPTTLIFNTSKISKNEANISTLEFDDDDLFNDSLLKCTQELEDALYNKNTGKFNSPANIHVNKSNNQSSCNRKLCNTLPNLETFKSKDNSDAGHDYNANKKLEKPKSSNLGKPKGKVLPLASNPTEIVSTGKVQLFKIEPETQSRQSCSNNKNNEITSCHINPSKDIDQVVNPYTSGKTNRASFQLGLPSVISKASKDVTNYKTSNCDKLLNFNKNICKSQLLSKNTLNLTAKLGTQYKSANHNFGDKVQMNKTINQSIENINLDNRLLIHNKTLSLDASSLIAENANKKVQLSQGVPFGQRQAKNKCHSTSSTVSKVTHDPVIKLKSFDYSMGVASQDLSSVFESGISEEDNDDEFFNSLIPFVEEEERNYANLTQCMEDSKNKLDCNPTLLSKDLSLKNISSTKDTHSVKPTISELSTKNVCRNSFKFQPSVAMASNSQLQRKNSSIPKFSKIQSTDIVKRENLDFLPPLGFNKLQEILPNKDTNKFTSTANVCLPSQPHFASKHADEEDEDFFDDDMLEEISMMESQQPQSQIMKPKQSITSTKNNMVHSETRSESNLTTFKNGNTTCVAGQMLSMAIKNHSKNDQTATKDELSRFDEFFSLGSPVSLKNNVINSELKYNPNSIKDPTNLGLSISKSFIPKNNFDQPIVNNISNYKSSLRSFSRSNSDNSSNGSTTKILVSQHRCTQDEIARKRQEALKKRQQSHSGK